MNKLKTCYICKKSLPLKNFYLDKNGYYNFCCRLCDRKRKVLYRLENKEKIALAEHKNINTERGYVMEVINGIFYRYRRKGSRPKWKPEFTKEQLYAELMLYIQDFGRICQYCKKPWTYKRILNNKGVRIETNFSIDRLDTTKTYKLDNIVFCCSGCNNRKSRVRLSDIINIMKVYVERIKK